MSLSFCNNWTYLQLLHCASLFCKENEIENKIRRETKIFSNLEMSDIQAGYFMGRWDCY